MQGITLEQWKKLVQQLTSMTDEQWEKRQRVLKILGKLESYRTDELEKTYKVVTSFWQFFLNNQHLFDKTTGQFINESDVQRFMLENTLTQQDLPKEKYLKRKINPKYLEELEMDIDLNLCEVMATAGEIPEDTLIRWNQFKLATICMERFDELLRAKHRFYYWLYKYRIKHNISGICPNVTDLVGEIFPFPFLSPEKDNPELYHLPLIPSDLEFLERFKNILVSKALEIGKKHNSNYYVLDGLPEYDFRNELKPVSFKDALEIANKKQKVWVSETYKTRDNYQFYLQLTNGLLVKDDNPIRIYVFCNKQTPESIWG